MRVFRRVMLGGGIDIDVLPDTQKLYYKATAKITPKSNSLGSLIIANKWDATTSEGIIVCSSDITIIDATFRGKSVLTSVIIPESVTIIDTIAFEDCTSLTSVTIPDSVTSIGDYAFKNCTSLTSITIGNGITAIPYAIFWGCTSLTSVTIPDSVTTIGSISFADCTSLKSITIPYGVTIVGGGAFNGCTSMQYYDFSTHESVPALMHTSVFNNIPSTCKIIVPDALYDEWIAATNWSTYASNIIKKSDWDVSQTTE